MILPLLLLVGCPKPKPELPPALVTSPDIAPIPAGRVVDGAYVDGTWPLIVAVPKGWTTVVGEDGAAERVTLTDPDGDVRVIVAGTRSETLAPRAIAGCSWTFADASRYRTVKITGQVMAATCTPDDPSTARVLAYVVLHEGMAWHIEGSVTPGRLLAGKIDLDEVAGGVRFR